MKININYKLLKMWFEDCKQLVDLYQYNATLTMDIEWAILKNYRQLTNAMNQYEEHIADLTKKYGSLQADGSYVVDESSEDVLRLFHNACKDLQNQRIQISLEKIEHKYLIGRQGVTLETMSLFDFMIY